LGKVWAEGEHHFSARWKILSDGGKWRFLSPRLQRFIPTPPVVSRCLADKNFRRELMVVEGRDWRRIIGDFRLFIDLQVLRKLKLFTCLAAHKNLSSCALKTSICRQKHALLPYIINDSRANNLLPPHSSKQAPTKFYPFHKYQELAKSFKSPGPDV